MSETSYKWSKCNLQLQNNFVMVATHYYSIVLIILWKLVVNKLYCVCSIVVCNFCAVLYNKALNQDNSGNDWLRFKQSPLWNTCTCKHLGYNTTWHVKKRFIHYNLCCINTTIQCMKRFFGMANNFYALPRPVLWPSRTWLKECHEAKPHPSQTIDIYRIYQSMYQLKLKRKYWRYCWEYMN